MIFILIVLMLLKSIEGKGECFRELTNKTFEHNEIVGPKFTSHDSADISQEVCMQKCMEMYECLGMTYEVIMLFNLLSIFVMTF